MSLIGRKVKVDYVRSLGRTTDQDLTGPVRREERGTLVQLRVGDLLKLHRLDGRTFTTTAVEMIRWLRATPSGAVEVVGHTFGPQPPSGLEAGPDLLCEVHTARSVYRVVAER